MKVRKANTAVGQGVDVGSLDLSSKGPRIGEAEIIGNNHEKVGFPGHDSGK